MSLYFILVQVIFSKYPNWFSNILCKKPKAYFQASHNLFYFIFSGHPLPVLLNEATAVQHPFQFPWRLSWDDDERNCLIGLHITISAVSAVVWWFIMPHFCCFQECNWSLLLEQFLNRFPDVFYWLGWMRFIVYLCLWIRFCLILLKRKHI